MKMYVWGGPEDEDDFLRDYSSGLGVAVAESVEEARELLLAAIQKWENDGYAPSSYYTHHAIIDLKHDPKVFDLPVATFVQGGS